MNFYVRKALEFNTGKDRAIKANFTVTHLTSLQQNKLRDNLLKTTPTHV
jgi:hypothetical protein